MGQESERNSALELFAIVNPPKPCKEGTMCKNSPFHDLHPKCNDCRLSPVFWGMAIVPKDHQWKPVSKRWKNAILEKEKRDANRRKVLERQQVRRNKDRDRQAILKSAAQAESRTQKEIIKATRNSGRVNRDGDHLLFGRITLDTKLQSGAENPTVKLQELDKVRNDAKRSGNPIGGLCIKNKNGRSIVVFDLRDVAKQLRPKGVGEGSSF
jgi:hypothetical protein